MVNGGLKIVMEQKSVAELEGALGSEVGLERFHALIELNTVLGNSDYQKSVGICREAVSVATALGDTNLMALARNALGNSLWKTGHNEEAQEHYAISLSLYLELKDYKGLTRVYCGLGIVHGSLNDSANALEFFEKGEMAAIKANDDVMLAHNLGNIGHIHVNVGDHITALKYFAKALSIDRALGAEGMQGVANMLGAIAGVMVFQGEFDGAIEKLEECLRIDEDIANWRGIAVSLMNMGITHRKAGRLAESITYLNRALAYAEKIHLGSLLPQIYQQLAETYEEIGDTNEAYRCLRKYNEYKVAEQRLHLQRKARNIVAPDIKS
jgi:tetratricopeptide (TPR) repeat protein